MHIYKRKIFGYECDLYGHLNNSRYLNLCEEARSVALEQTEFSIDTLYKMNIYMFVRNINVEYIKSIPVGSEVTIESIIIKYSRLRSIWKQTLRNKKNEICSIVTVDVVFTKNNKPSRLPKEIFENLGNLI